MSTQREYNEWIVMRWMAEDKDYGLPRVLLIGDSIVGGHGMKLHDALCDDFIVDYFASSKIVSDVDYWTDLEYMLHKKKYVLILFNNGLHGATVSDDEYAAALKSAVVKLKTYAPVLVWRNSTPCYTLDPEHPNTFAPRVPVRNTIAEKIMQDAGVPILDAYSLLKNRPELSVDGWHFTPEGYQILIDAEKELIGKMLKGACGK